MVAKSLTSSLTSSDWRGGKLGVTNDACCGVGNVVDVPALPEGFPGVDHIRNDVLVGSDGGVSCV